jgi:hypothetical protein
VCLLIIKKRQYTSRQIFVYSTSFFCFKRDSNCNLLQVIAMTIANYCNGHCNQYQLVAINYNLSTGSLYWVAISCSRGAIYNPDCNGHCNSLQLSLQSVPIGCNRLQFEHRIIVLGCNQLQSRRNCLRTVTSARTIGYNQFQSVSFQTCHQWEQL